MKKQYFKCKLESDIVINASLATEGNMRTLDYIPGSNFLGIVAGQLYKELGKEGAHEVFHSDKVSFGNAHLCVGDAQSYAMPFALTVNKLKKEVETDKVWLHHTLTKHGYRPEKEQDKKEANKQDNQEKNYLQLKQHRSGYLNPNKRYIKKIERKFSLKSAQDRATRKSADEKMFGFESIRKGQQFIFSVAFANETYEAKYKDKIVSALVGRRRVGKSKSAQYGQVEIEAINPPKTFKHKETKDNQLIIYAESNLCFFNEYGQSTFQPTAEDFKVKGEINWGASQIRTYSYSPWNFHRNTMNTQRDCIQQGSVIVIDIAENKEVQNFPSSVGAYQSEGLGRVIYNPEFLVADSKNGEWTWANALISYEGDTEPLSQLPITNSPLGEFLERRKQKIEAELKIGQAVQAFLQKYQIFQDVSTSQWGGIRSIAIQAKNIGELKEQLFGFNRKVKDKNKGFLMNGVAAEEYWDKQRGFKRDALWKVIEDNESLGTTFIAKMATEMAKLKQQKQN